MRRQVRLRALLLTALFVGVGSVAPLVDAVLFHQGAEVARPHIETRDNPACHGERCVIPLSQITSSGTPAILAVAVPAVSVADRPIARPSSSSPSAFLSGSRRSRAPPSLLA
ncbi:MAG TPA: hypothetical protein VFI39_07840 [Gemmatimonadales bacterium]|nr:hypothetical protein [Gemmatimonadales bacterium]